MRIWIDCEFNGHLGDLISLALVTEDGAEFYRVIEMFDPVDPWVAENVMKVLLTSPIPMAQFHTELEAFLKPYGAGHLSADWTEDIAYFVRALTTGPGTRLDTPPLTMEIVRYDAPSELPHNALADARGIRDYMLAEERGQQELFYIQDGRQYVGNCPLWWGPDNSGYVTRIDHAGKYPKDFAERQCASRSTDKAWPCSVIDKLVRPTIDIQDMRRLRRIEDIGLEVQP